MNINHRQAEISEELKKEKRMSVSALARKFHVSEMTIRRDLKILEEKGCIKRYNGGAIFCSDEICLPIGYRKMLHAKQKAELAKRTKKFLGDSMNIFLDSSSTCSYIIPILSEYENIHIVTNSVQSTLAATEYNISCTLVGGNFYARDMCTVGSICDAFLQNINVDIAFFSSLGLSDDGLITDCDEFQNSVRKTVMKNCQTNIFLFDSHKLHKKYLYTLCCKDDVTELIIL